MKKNLLLLLLLIIIPYAGSAQDRDGFPIDQILNSLNSEERAELEKEKVVFRAGRTRKGLFYLPDLSLAELIGDRHNALDPDVTVEAFFKIPYPDDMPADENDRNLILYNIVREVSKISGVQYWSTSRKRYKVLFDDVYIVDGDKKPLDDRLVNTIPAFDSFEIHMDESNLGRAFYRAEYRYNDKNMIFSLTNTSDITFLFKVVGAEDMQIDLLMMPYDKEILIYGYSGVKLANPRFVNRIMDPFASFFMRLYAMEIWFVNTLNGTDNLPEKDILERENP